MEDSPSSRPVFDPSDYLTVIWRRKWIVILFMVVVVAITLSASLFLITPLYQSSSELLIQKTGLENALLGTSLFDITAFYDERDIQTKAEMVKSPVVTSAVQESLGSGEEVSGSIDVSPVKETNVIRITATDDDPETARDLANAYAVEFINWRRSSNLEVLQEARLMVEQQIAQSSAANQEVLQQKLEDLRVAEALQTGNVELIKEATLPASPVSPKPFLYTIVALIASLIIGSGMVLVINRFDTRIREIEEIEENLELPIIGTIPAFNNSSSGSTGTIVVDDPMSNQAEGFRMLRTNLQYVDLDQTKKSILITSPEPSEGKSTTLSNLGLTMASAGKKVILLDADFRRPTLSHHLDLDNSIGLTNVVAGNCSLREALQLVDIRNLGKGNDTHHGTSPQKVRTLDNTQSLYCATTGPLPPNPGEIVSSRQIAEIIEAAKSYADLVLIDSPPLMAVSDAASLASSVDGVILVMKMNETSRNSFPKTRRFIDSIPCPSLGLVVTNLSRSDKQSPYGYY